MRVTTDNGTGGVYTIDQNHMATLVVMVMVNQGVLSYGILSVYLINNEMQEEILGGQL